MAKTRQTVDSRERILLADDEDMVRKAIRLVLACRGYQIIEAVDGEDAVQKYVQASPPFDLVLLDFDMPRLSGLEALLQIRNHHAHAKAILLSGGVLAPEQREIIFLQKPFENQELIRLVRETLDARRPKAN